MPKKYTVASEEGATRYGAEVGATVELELSESDERALLAAEWLTETDSKATTMTDDKKGGEG